MECYPLSGKNYRPSSAMNTNPVRCDFKEFDTHASEDRNSRFMSVSYRCVGAETNCSCWITEIIE